MSLKSKKLKLILVLIAKTYNHIITYQKIKKKNY